MAEILLSWACALVLVGTPGDSHLPTPGRAGSRVSTVNLGLLVLAAGLFINILPTQVTWLGNSGSCEIVP